MSRICPEPGWAHAAARRLETTAADTKLSTVERFANALGYSIEYHLVPAGKSKHRQGIVVES
jgi:hypothetical protein